MSSTELVDELIARVEELKDLMEASSDNFEMDAFLLQAIVSHANDETLSAIIEVTERFILKQEYSE